MGDDLVGADYVVADQEILGAGLQRAEGHVEGIVGEAGIRDRLVVAEVLTKEAK